MREKDFLINRTNVISTHSKFLPTAVSATCRGNHGIYQNLYPISFLDFLTEIRKEKLVFLLLKLKENFHASEDILKRLGAPIYPRKQTVSR